MTAKRIQVYTDPETKRRIELAAARQNVAVTQYCLQAIRERLVEDDVMEQEQIEIPVKPQASGTLLAELRALREKIKARRGGDLIERDLVNDVREDRDDEIFGLR